jgi:peptidoglycan/LPS O-acetylase OafA/YrhL
VESNIHRSRSIFRGNTMTKKNARQTTQHGELSIDALRGAAALMVAYLHGREVAWIGMRDYWHAHRWILSLDSALAWLSAPVMFGSIGVPVFFFLSGYCIHRGVARRRQSDPHWRPDAGAFWLRRVVRIYPVLIGALLLTWGLDTASAAYAPQSYKLGSVDAMTFLANLLALQGIAGPHFGSNGALWTLALEIQFYACYPMLLALRDRFGLHRVLGAVALLNVLSWAVLERHGITVFPSYYLSWCLGFYIAEREAGARVCARDSRWRFGGMALLVAGCVVFAISQYAAFQVWALGFACYLWRLLAVPYRPGVMVRALARVGMFSYSLYVVHLPIFVWLMSRQYHSQKPDSIVPSLVFLLVAGALAYVFHRLVERPAQSILAMRRNRAVHVTANV